MTLPRVSIMATAGEAPVVTVDGSPVAGVRSAQVTVTADGVPQVSLVLAATVVDTDLSARVTVLQAGPSAADFAERVDPRRLERDALEHIEALTQGEAFAAAVRAQAADYDDR